MKNININQIDPEKRQALNDYIRIKVNDLTLPGHARQGNKPSRDSLVDILVHEIARWSPDNPMCVLPDDSEANNSFIIQELTKSVPGGWPENRVVVILSCQEMSNRYARPMIPYAYYNHATLMSINEPAHLDLVEYIHKGQGGTW